MGGRDQKTALPKNWPPEIGYLTAPAYAPELTRAQVRALRSRPPGPGAGDDLPVLPAELVRPGPSPLVRIVTIADPAHPARGQRGLFAARDLRPGQPVLRYLGEVHPPASARHAASDYDLWLDRAGGGAGAAVDAARVGNEARFVNDYRGVPGKARANAEFREAWDGSRGERVMAVFVAPAGKRGAGKGKAKGKEGAAAGIARGEEVLVSYGKGFWGERREAEGGREGEEREREEEGGQSSV